MFTIAHKFGVRISQLKEWNQLIDKKPLQPRQKLIVVINVINSNMNLKYIL
ncbi:MAG: LysM peptidoglycan-binding domain-containing protein [Candidatus Vesicomyosocius endoextente]|uniref:LysM peptidoglycan-binding domain-containing protein n=1 Tax=Candidatus Vesicomyosocius endoextente TaxID=2738853 RepID=A0A853GBT0_9GAMM|nr:LysM peptidoglycan-binding domain-containing protein [Candidatus Vesicomyosocius endoextente]